MNVQQFLLQYKNKFGAIKDRYRFLYPIFEDYEEEFYIKEKGADWIENKYCIYFDIFKKKFYELLDLEIKETENIIFVLNLKETNFDAKYNEFYIHSFSCKKQDILDKMEEDFSLWNDNLSRIEHYCYDYTPTNEILGTELFYSENICEIDVICELLHQLFIHGFTEEQKIESFNNLYQEIEKSLKDVEEGNYIDADEIFMELEQEILNEANDEEKESIIAQRKEKEKNKYRDQLFLRLIMKINHKECIKLIEEWCINEILKGKIK